MKICFRLIVFISCCAFCFSCTKPAENPPVSVLDPASLVKGDTIHPFAFIDTKNHDWHVVVRISGEDLVDVSHKLKTRMFSTTNTELIKKIRKWKFIYHRHGVTRASSTLRVFKDDELVETYGIVLEKEWVGLQSKELGLIKSVHKDELLEIIREMN